MLVIQTRLSVTSVIYLPSHKWSNEEKHPYCTVPIRYGITSKTVVRVAMTSWLRLMKMIRRPAFLPVSADPQPVHQSERDLGSHYWHCCNYIQYSCFPCFSNRRRNPFNRQKRTYFQAELDKYLTFLLIFRSEDSILPWKKNFASFLPLKKMVLKYLSSPPSSVASERLLSTARNVCTGTGNCLLPENANRLVFIMKNKKLLNKQLVVSRNKPFFRTSSICRK